MIKDIYSYDDNLYKYENTRSECVIKGEIEDPIFSIFIPTYKRVESLKETINSAISQKCNVDYEIVIVSNDPDSKDNEVRDVIKSINDKHIYYYVNTQNIGPCGNWNKGILLSRGKYIGMIHDDDILSPWYISAMVNAIRDENEPSIIGVSYSCFNSKHMPLFERPGKLSYRKVTKKSFFWGKYINIAGMAVNKDFITMIGGYQEDYHPCFDTYMIYQGILFGKVVNVEHELAGYRKEFNDSMSESTMTNVIYRIDQLRKNIAEKERFANWWMRVFGKEYLYLYIMGANKSWSMDLEPYWILEECGYSKTKVSIIKVRIMKTLLKILKKVG